jgi:nucleotide-binding universal stress UspA family protein
MYNRILVPLDGSQRAEAILPHVARLASCFSAEVVLVQVIEPLPEVMAPGVPAMSLPIADINEHTAAAEAYLAGIKDELDEQGLRVRLLVPYGQVVDQIIATADQEEADLIAIASHGRGGLARLFYGSVASALLQHVDQPLLMVRSRDER